MSEIYKPESVESNIRRESKMQDEELGNLIAAVGNHEGKALMVAAMKEDRAYTPSELAALFRNSQGHNPVWKVDHSAVHGWCEDTFVPIGLVAREIVDTSLRSTAFIKTAYGFKQGDALVGHLLSLSERYPANPLNHVFGQTGSSKGKTKEISGSLGIMEFKKRAPITAYRIFWELVTTESFPIRREDLIQALGEEDQTLISGHLDRLGDLGYIDYVRTGVDEPISTFRLAENQLVTELLPYAMNKSLARFVINIVRSMPGRELSIPDIQKALLETPEGVHYQNRKDLPNVLAAIMTDLHKQSFLERTNYEFGVSKRSEISLTPEQRTFLSEIVTLLYEFQLQSEDFIHEGRHKAHAIISDPNRVAALAAKAKEASPYVHNTTQQTMSDILSILSAFPTSATSEDIQQVFLQEPYTRRISKGRINVLLKQLMEMGSVVIESRRGAAHWKSRW